MIQFAQIEYLAIILVIPFLFLFYGFTRRARRKRLEKFGERALVEKLIPDASRSRGWIKITLWSLAIFFFAVGLSRPQLGARLKEVETTGVEIMIALDVSNSMLAEDYTPNRLDRAKLAISRLVDKMKQDRIGLIVFAGKAFVQLPITADYISAKIFLNSISTNSVPVQGTAMGDAILTAVKGFSLESSNSRAIVIITDGENHEDDPVQAAKEAQALGIPVFTIGIGTEAGKPIPAGNGELLKDKDGNIVVTKLDEKTLSEVAQAGGGAYVRAGNSDFGLEAIVNQIHNMDKQQYKSVVFEDFDEQYMYFFAIALLFLLLEFLVGEKRGRNLFKSIRRR
ncbi:MAG: VWA domain-containing protein [Bacteroidales bacterium]|jgi:Ca-activated chloride channel family protein|nr:VWA domain-containing protein [Bacteroidales bacterium]MDD4058078.1 VWA domain-containing protein [Bacteroidales bacterium]